MAFNIEVLSTSVEPRGKFQMLTVNYKDPNGKVDGKKIASFDAQSKEVYKTLAKAQPGDLFNVTSEKVDNYWKWTAIETAGKNVGGGTNVAVGVRPNQTSKSTFETPEERAKRQVYIVRQSSLSAAIDTLKTDKKNPTPDEVIALAKQYESFVFDTGEFTHPSIFTDDELKEPEIT